MGSYLSGESRSPNPGSPSTPLGVRRRRNSKRRFGSRSSSFDYKKDEYLLKIPGRLFFNGSSEIASLFTQQGKKGTNQDAMVVWEVHHCQRILVKFLDVIVGKLARALGSIQQNCQFCHFYFQNFCSRTDTIFCGVFDGHGPYGHMVAKRVRDSLPQKLNAQWDVNMKDEVLREISINSSSLNSEATSFISIDEEPRVFVDVEDVEKEPDIFHVLKESFLKAFKSMDRELRVHPNVDCFCSGTTAVTLIKQGQDLVIGNVGDSRAVLGTRNKDNSLVAVQLTVDLKPNLPAEAERIKKCRGRVLALRDEPDVARVWLPNNDSPGLAMARAFGDFCLKEFGLIAVPDVSYRRLTEKDEFIVLATDGIWDVLSNKEVIDIVAAAASISTASKLLVENAVRAWKLKYPTSKIDDCAVICLFLDSSLNNLSSASTSTSQDKEQTDPKEVAGPTGLGETTKERNDTEDAMLLQGYRALDGVTRVNTLVNLPRFTAGKK